MGLRDSFRRAFAASDPPKGEAGAEGDSRYGELLGSWETNGAWYDWARWDTIDEMRKTDASVKSTLWLFNLPIRGAKWDAEAVSEDGVDQLVADYIRWNLGLGDEDGQMAQSWSASVAQALLFLPFGSFFEELVWADDVAPWPGEPDTGRRALSRLAPRLPRTIEEVKRDRDGQIASVRQNILNTSLIPGEKLAYYALEPEGGDWRGTSILRAAWGPWKLKKELMIAAGIAWDRHGGGGMPIIKRPSNSGASGEREARIMGMQWRTHEHGYMTVEKGDTDANSWDIDVVQGQLADPVPLLRFYSEQIATNALQQFSSLGSTTHGSRAVGEVLSDPFYQAVTAIAQDLARERTRQVVRRIVDVNFGPQVEAPRITVSKIQSQNLETLANVIGLLAGAGLSFADREVQDALRDVMELPPLPEPDDPSADVPVEGGGLPVA